MSRTGRRITCGAAVASAIALGGPTHGETLADAIALAYQSNPTLQGQRATQRALDETYVQAQAAYGPTATVQASITTDANNSRGGVQPLPGQTQPLIPGQTQTSGAAVTITQPIFTGGRLSSQVSAAEASVLAGRETLRATEENVLQTVITVYVDVHRDAESVAIVAEDVALLKRQLDESQARFAVGDITRTDVAETQARVAASLAQLASAQAQLANSRAAYAAVVGQNPGALAPEPPLAKFLPTTLDQAFTIAEHNSPQVRQSDYTEQASAARVAAAKAQTRPTLSLQASAGYTGGGLPGTPFINFRHDVQASAVASLPLFTGGLTSSQIRQAAETNNADRIAIETARRQVLLNVAQAWNQLLGARAALAADAEQVRAANIAFEGSRQEARVGLRTTLDVLIAEQNLGAAELAQVVARHDEYVAAATLLATTGSLFAQDLAAEVPLYDPKTNFDRVRHAWPWTPWAPAVEALDKAGAPQIIERPAPAGP